MNNDVIELAREMKKRSEAVLSAYACFMKSNSDEDRLKFQADNDYLDLMIAPNKLIALCEAVEKLAEYENMEPVAWGSNTGMGRIMVTTTLPVIVSEWQEFNESHPDIADDIFPLYRHPNK
ncbi:hypothetical protein [Xenorhabdus sp. KK7.4]|uniref:hypothetical protein n=1 Tax=Xenorhabdus sp. KK7.4 TaxID=1851572 RepID=UPI000C041EC0|nr:hypothetical protein [Xenorhabdus sp. KK7.4]PHM48389.1 hypothetical protein Xekk_04430 [Xenorhabdus sp. KK7.4]